jgi:hypothetical protein
MDNNLSSEANSPSASQKIACSLYKPNDLYRVHNSPPLDLILSQMNPTTHSQPISPDIF